MYLREKSESKQKYFKHFSASKIDIEINFVMLSQHKWVTQGKQTLTNERMKGRCTFRNMYSEFSQEYKVIHQTPMKTNLQRGKQIFLASKKVPLYSPYINDSYLKILWFSVY